MYVDELADLFRDWCDDRDPTFLSPANVAMYLRRGFDQYQRIIADSDPNILAVRERISLVNAVGYDLALGTNPVRLMGVSVNRAPLLRLQELFSVHPDDTIKQVYDGVATLRLLHEGGGQNERPRYCFVGTELLFGRSVSETFVVLYIPYGSQPEFATGIDWTRQTSGQLERIDNHLDFQELIALKAYELYAIRDGAANPILDRRTQVLTAEFQAHLTVGRDVSSHSRVDCW
jgi:hypothetical protein